MKTPLNLPDIIDLEYLFYQDKEKPPALLHQRDREIQLSLEKEAGRQSDCKLEEGQEGEEICEKEGGKRAEAESRYTRHSQLRRWLTLRLAEEFPSPDQRSPGALFADSLRFGKIAAVLKGAFAGIAAGIAFFAYSGKTPVNVFQFLLLFIGSQIILALLLLAALAIRRFAPQFRLPDFYSLLFERSFTAFVRWLQRKWNKGASAASRNAACHALSIAKVHNGRYGRLFYWSLFSLTQLFALSFNIALLLVMLLKIAATDLAFGWQSTIQLSDNAIYSLAKTLALPWSWIIGAASPSLETISGSRIVLKEGIAALATSDLTGWWPFLVMSLLVYGVLTRLTFFGFGLFMEQREKNLLRLDTPQIEALLRRMQTPVVSTQAAREEPKAEGNQEREEEPPQLITPLIQQEEAEEENRQKSSEDGGTAARDEIFTLRELPELREEEKRKSEIEKRLQQSEQSEKRDQSVQSDANALLSKRIVLVGIDLFEQLPKDNPTAGLEAALVAAGFTAETVIAIQDDYDEDQQLLPRLGSEWPQAEGVLIILEGWMVPLVDFLSYLGSIRKSIAGGLEIGVALLGRPEKRDDGKEAIFTTISRRDFTIWRQKVETLADPYLHLFPLIGMEDEGDMTDTSTTEEAG